MPTESELVCPVCRAKQAYQSECRRCAADLSLFIKALRSLHIAQQHIATTTDNLQQVDTLHYLHWLSPKAAQAATVATKDRS